MTGSHRPRIYLSATRKSSGKTTISAGICGALRARGLAVQPFKKGPDYIDPMWLGRLSGRPCYNLDFNTQSREEIRDFIASKSHRADVSLIEGNKGLFDGVDVEGSDCNAAMARLIGAAIVLVIDCDGITRGIAPLINGYQDFDEGLNIDAVILNRIGGTRHESKLRAMVENYTDVEVVGAVQRDPALALDERHLGLITDAETADAEAQSSRLIHAINQQVNLDRLLEIGDRPDLPMPVASEPVRSQPIHIGIARDSAFCFYYADDLESLHRQADRVSYFSPLSDTGLPDCDALLFGGGFPETHASALQSNSEMRRAVLGFAGSGKPIYAECGGLMYLGCDLTWQGQRYEMVGALPLQTTMQDRPVGRGYVQLVPSAAHPWLGQTSDQAINAHEFHYSSATVSKDQIHFGYDVRRGFGVDGERDGVVSGNVFASYAHLRNTHANPWISRFLASVHRQMSEAA